MRSLFVKIFLWFWMAQILMIGAVVMTRWMSPDPRHAQFRTVAGDIVTLYGERAIDRLEQEGAAATRGYIEQVDQTTGMRLYLFARNGNELLGQSPPPKAVELASGARGTGDTEMDRTWEHGFVLARRVSGTRGNEYVVVALPPGGGVSDMLSAPYTIVMRFLGVLAITGILCYGLARYVTRPLRRLQTSARQLAEGDLSVRVGRSVGNRHDEIGGLGRDFDFMAERVESLVSTQQQLLRDMSHELRSPLARLNVALGLAVQRAGPEAQSALERIDREAHRLNELIGTLLTLTRLEGAQHSDDRAAVHLASLVLDVVSDADFEARDSNRQVTLQRCDMCVTAGSPDLLRSAIENVVRNGIRHTADGTSVEVSLIREPVDTGVWAVVRIRDHGPGVPEACVEEIFRPFRRVGDDRDRQTGGAGLGLAIARQAVRLHGGTISARNAPDGGLIVELTLPASLQV